MYPTEKMKIGLVKRLDSDVDTIDAGVPVGLELFCGDRSWINFQGYFSVIEDFI